MLGRILREALAKRGISEVVTFFSAMPPLLAGWYFLLGWFFDWFGYRWRRSRQPPMQVLPPP